MLVWASCQSEEEVPQEMIQPEQMKEVLIDLHLAEAWKERRKMAEDTALIFIKSQYEEIFKMHDITRPDFEQSLDYYERHPDFMDEIYQEVINEMSRREGELKAKKKKKHQDKKL